MNDYSLNLKSVLMKLLDDTDIKNKIRVIADTKSSGISATDESELQKELEKTKKELKKEKKRTSDLETELQEMKAENNSLKEKIKPVEYIAEIWNGLTILDEKKLEYLRKLCGGGEIQAYIVLGKELKKIRQLREQIEIWAVDDSNSNEMIKALSNYFDMCIQTYNITNNKALNDGKDKFEEIVVSEGDDFDSNKCTKTSASKFNGTITQILVRGYKNDFRNEKYLPIVKIQ